ncbi:MAG TPA: DNA polymerase IV [bacterium]|nr:DNA polymerase IV [bacterium]
MSERLTAFPVHQARHVGGTAEAARRIMHIDMDAYFAALEQRANPKLRGRPVIVGSTSPSRGVVSTASYESRAYGIRSGMSSAEAHRLCPDGIFIGVDPDHYVTVSAELIRIFNEFAPKVEAVSVDEAFLDVTGCGALFGGEEALAQKLKERIRATLSLSCSIGIAPTRVLAKLASSVFKPDGLTIIHPPDIATVLYPLPVDKLWGIGPVATGILVRAGIRTVGDLARADLKHLRRLLGQTGTLMGQLARGNEQTPVLNPEQQPEEKSIGHERTFPRDSADPDFLQATLHYLADLVSRRMRRLGFRGRTITVRIRHADFTTLTRRNTLETATDNLAVIYKRAAAIFQAHWDERTPIRLLGISVSQLEHVDDLSGQTDLFADAECSREGTRRRLDAIVDQIRDRFGEDSIQGAFSYLGIDG